MSWSKSGLSGKIVEAHVEAGAINPGADLVTLDSSAGAMSLTLADGPEGQRMTIVHVGTGTNIATVTPASFALSTIKTNAANELVDLVFANGQWVVVENVGSVAVA